MSERTVRDAVYALITVGLVTLRRRGQGLTNLYHVTRIPLRGPQQPVQWLIDGVLQLRSTAMLFGPTGIGKTFLSLDLALAVATGQPWWGRAVTPGPVCYLAGEGIEDVHNRCTAWAQARGVTPANIYFWPQPINLLDGEAVSTFLAHLPVDQPRLVIIDTLAANTTGANENAAQDMGLFNAQADRIRRATGATVLVIHHTGWDTSRPRGSTNLPANLSTELALRESDEVLTLEIKKQRNAPDTVPLWHFHKAVVPTPTGTSVVLRLASGVRSLREGRQLSPRAGGPGLAGRAHAQPRHQ